MEGRREAVAFVDFIEGEWHPEAEGQTATPNRLTLSALSIAAWAAMTGICKGIPHAAHKRIRRSSLARREPDSRPIPRLPDACQRA